MQILSECLVCTIITNYSRTKENFHEGFVPPAPLLKKFGSRTAYAHWRLVTLKLERLEK